jgi:ketosteroid isomerase-like protein
MRYLALGALVCLCASASLRAQAADPQVMAPITKFVEAFNKGDMAGAAATHAADADLVIIDEVSPFIWRGAKALQTWVADLDRDAKKHGITDQKVTLSPPTRVETTAAEAYVIVPTVYSFKENGVAMREAAQMTLTLKKDAGGWLIHGWAWTGPKAHKASGPAGK